MNLERLTVLSIVGITAIATIVALPAPKTEAGAYYVETCIKSRLCRGLVEHFTLDELNDWPRFGAFGTVLHEAVTQNVNNRAGKISNALDITGSSTSYLWRSYAPGVSGFFTLGAWFSADALPSSGGRAALISWTNGGNFQPGTSLWLFNNAGTTKVCIYVINHNSDAASEICHSTALSASTWYYVAAGVEDSNDTPGGRQAFISLNGGSKETTALSFVNTDGFPHVRIGQRPVGGPTATGDYLFDGAIDGLSIWARALTNGEISLLYNAGSGQAYPFVTE